MNPGPRRVQHDFRAQERELNRKKVNLWPRSDTELDHDNVNVPGSDLTPTVTARAREVLRIKSLR